MTQIHHIIESFNKVFNTRVFLFGGILLITTAFLTQAQTIDISEALQQGEGRIVQVQGIVLNTPNERNLRFIQDSTAGLPIYVNDDAFNQNVRKGDLIQIRGELDEFNGLLEINEIFEYEVVKVNQSLPEIQPFANNRTAVRVSLSCLWDREFSPGLLWQKGSQSVIWNGIYSEVWVPEKSNVIGLEKESNIFSGEGIGYLDDDGYHFLLQDISYQSDEGCIFWKNAPSLVNAGIDFLQFEFSLYQEAEARAIVRSESDLYDTIYSIRDSLHSVIIPSLEPASFYQVYWEAYTERDTLLDSTGLFITQSLSSKDIDVFFNNPVQFEVVSPFQYTTRGIDMVEEIVARIESARESIDICLYNFNNQDIKSALEEAQDRGITIRCIADGDNSNIGFRNTDLNVFRTAYGNPLMHNKFIIVDANIADNAWLFMGATNLTPRQIFEDPNSSLGIEDQMLARVYEKEFEELWGSTGPEFDPLNDQHGSDKADDTPHQMFLGTSFVQSYFSPSDGTTQAIAEVLASAEEEVYFSLLTFTKNELRNVLIDLHERGVDVKGIIENVDDTGGEFYRLNSEGIEVIDDTKGRIHHHKYAIVDPNSNTNAKLIIGSHNWTQKAEDTNDENTLIFYDHDLSLVFLSEFYGRWCEYMPANEMCDQDTMANAEDVNLILSPNPSSAKDLRMFFNNDASLEFNIEVFDITGRSVKSLRRVLDPGYNTIHQLSGLVPGQYLIRCNNADHSFSLRSIIIF